ncbi:glycoside hydrolase family 47 protein [Apiospora arundinis]
MMEKEALEAAALSVIHRKLISGSHILHHHNILDAYGHLSVRHPFKPDVFILSRDAAPATITSPRDLVEYWVKDASPVDGEDRAPKGFAERHIHSELYRAYPSIQSVVHSHADAVLPYTINGVPLRPCYHMAGFLGHWSPVWDIASARGSGGGGGIPGDMLVRTEALGAALAQQFKYSTTVVLMRGHGFTAIAGEGGGIEEAVFRAVYTAQNAAIQSAAMTAQAAYHSRNHDAPLQPIKFLSPEEAEASRNMARDTVMRPWGLWLREVEASNLYLNSA